MTSLFGTTQAFQGLAGTYLYLAPNCGDKVFGTDINYCSLTNWGIYDGQEKDAAVLNLYKKQRNSCMDGMCDPTSKFTQSQKEDYDRATSTITPNGSTTKTTVWSLIQSHPRLSKWKKIVEKTGYDKYINELNGITYVTMFAPVNESIPDEWMSNLQNVTGNSIRPLAQAHTLPFQLDQKQAYGKKLRLYTSLETYSVYLDGTGEVRDTLNFYIPPEDILNLRYPQPLSRINILQGYYSNNGALYLIDGMFSPNVVVN